MYAVGQNQSSDRLFEIDTQDIPSISTEPTADMLDPTTSPRAQAMDQMINKSAQEHKQQIEENLKNILKSCLTKPGLRHHQNNKSKIFSRKFMLSNHSLVNLIVV